MALKALLLKKQIDNKRKELEALRKKDADFTKREAELAQAVEEVTNDAEKATVEEAVNAFDAEKAAHTEAVGALEREIEGLENDLEAEEAKQDTTPPATPPAQNEQREENNTMITREARIPGMTLRDRLATIVTREDVKNYLTEVRSAMKEKRAINNVGLTIPEVMLGLLRENVTYYSKLYKHVDVRRVGGTGKNSQWDLDLQHI